MKNFFKKLSFVLALAMVLTSIAPATASAATKDYIAVKGGKQASTVYVFIGGVSCDLDFSGSTKGTWKSADESIAKVDKNGVITPVANGKVKISFVSKDGKTLAKQTVRVCTRAKKLNVYDYAEYAAGTKNVLNGGEVAMKVGEKKDLQITMPISAAKKAAGAKSSSYASYCTAISDEAVVAVTKVNDRKYTLEAKAAGEATITIAANQTSQANVYKNSKFVEAKFTVKVADEFGIVDVTAKKVNELEVTMSAPVDTTDVTLTVTKKDNAVDAKVVWNADKTVATITTTAKMTVGTYTVKATSAADAAKKAEKSVEIENQYVAEIQILNDVALTGAKTVGSPATVKDAMKAYVYYKVVDQYGEDLTSSTSIQWNTSCGDPKRNDRALGRLTLERTDDKAFTYGEQIFVTGVYTKTGKSVQATLTVGAAQALHSIDMVGFVKKNTSTIVETLPNGFRSGEYYLLYDGVDQNGNVLDASDYNDKDHITFVTDNVLVVKEVVADSFTTVVIDGHEYRAVLIAPGEYVDKGGEVNFTAIATKTGQSTKKNYVVGQNHILQSFVMETPSGVFADGETHEIPFTALDTNGEPITNFVTLADNLNKLTFSVSEGTLTLVEENDGTATLIYTDKAGSESWPSYTTDGIERIVSLTSVVVGGESDTLLLSISDKARPDAILSVALAKAYVEADAGFVDLNSFTFLDQYGRPIDPTKPYIYGVDNGFFAAAKNGGLTGLDFSGYRYDITMQYKGSAKALVANSGITSYDENKTQVGVWNTGRVSFAADMQTNTALTGNMFTFAISKIKLNMNTLAPATGEEYENVSPTYNHSFAVVDISQVKNFALADLSKQFIETSATNALTGELANISSTITATTSAIVLNGSNSLLDITGDYTQTLVLTGSYNGINVFIPAVYYKAEGNKLTLTGNKITGVTSAGIKWSDLYDVSTAKYLRKDTSDLLKVSIYNVFSNNAATMGVQVPMDRDSLRDVVSKNVTISDARPVLTTILAPETLTVKPEDTGINVANVVLYTLEYNHYNNFCIYRDQYNKPMFSAVSATYRVSNIEEAAAFADNNFTVSGNEDTNTFVNGAERGDTFVLTITARDNYYTDVVVSKDIKVTVGADTSAWMNQSKNNYTFVPVAGSGDSNGLKPILNNQRLNTLN